MLYSCWILPKIGYRGLLLTNKAAIICLVRAEIRWMSTRSECARGWLVIGQYGKGIKVLYDGLFLVEVACF